MRVNIEKLKEKVNIQIKPIKTYRGPFLSQEDIKELRKEAKKISDAYKRSWIRAREVYVK